MAQYFGQLAPQQPHPLGQALGQGLGAFAQRRRKEQQGGILSRVLSGEATQEEMAQLDPEYQLKAAQLMQPKAPPGGITGQPIPAETAKKLAQINRDNPDASAEELLNLYDEAGIERVFSIAPVETRRRTQLQKAQKEASKEEQIRKETLPLKQEIVKQANLAREGIFNKKRLLAVIDRGELNDPTYAAIVEALPARLGERMLSNDTVEYRAGIIDEFKDLRKIFQGQTRTAELGIIEKKIPGIYLTDAQKKGILKSRMNALQRDIIIEEAAEEVERTKPGLGILQYNREVAKIAKPKMEALFHRILDEQKFIIDQAEKRRDSGIPLDENNPEDEEIINQILDEANGNWNEAEKIAAKKGYKF